MLFESQSGQPSGLEEPLSDDSQVQIIVNALGSDRKGKRISGVGGHLTKPRASTAQLKEALVKVTEIAAMKDVILIERVKALEEMLMRVLAGNQGTVNASEGASYRNSGASGEDDDA